jgi:glycosyltransferase involved in cell wall biosynthesis
MSKNSTPAEKISLFIPTFNVGNAVGDVLRKIPSSTLEKLSHVLIVDNGSSDQTLEVVQAFVRASPHREKFHVFKNEQNYSLGGSTIVAFRTAMALGSDFVICMHSDGQASPEDLDEFIRRSKAGIDFVFGDRFATEGEYRGLRLWGNRFFSWLQRLLIRADLDDIGAYISFNLKTIAELPYARLPFDMGYHPTLVIYACLRRPIRFESFPIHWGKVEISNVNPFLYGLTHLKRILLLKTGLFRLNQKKPEDFKTTEL